jgi:four helix bundle protein
VQRYRQSPLWQRSKSLAAAVYLVTQEWPSEERFGLTSQTRRAAVSVMGNIAEGQGRVGSKELKHRLSIANGSLCEMESYLLLGIELGFNNEDDIAPALALSMEVGRMLTAAINRLE